MTKSAVMLFRTVVGLYVVMKALESLELIWKTIEVEVTFQFAGVWKNDIFQCLQRVRML